MGKTDKIKHKKVKGEKREYRSVSLPTSLVEDLAILRECYEDTWFPMKEEEGPRKKRKAVSYEKVFERLLSKSGLGHVDPDVYQEFVQVRKTRKEFPKVVKRQTKKAVTELVARAQENGTSLKEEARKVKEEAQKSLEQLRNETPYIDPDSALDPALSAMAGTVSMPTERDLQEDPRLQEAFGKKLTRTEKRFVHPDGRWFPATMGTSTWVPVDPKTNKWISAKPLKMQGFELKDVEI